MNAVKVDIKNIEESFLRSKWAQKLRCKISLAPRSSTTYREHTEVWAPFDLLRRISLEIAFSWAGNDHVCFLLSVSLPPFSLFWRYQPADFYWTGHYAPGERKKRAGEPPLMFFKNELERASPRSPATKKKKTSAPLFIAAQTVLGMFFFSSIFWFSISFRFEVFVFRLALSSSSRIGETHIT